MKIGILQAGHVPDGLRPEYGDLSDLFRALLCDQALHFESFDVVDMEFPPGIDACDGWLITGSKHGAYEDHPFIAPLEQFIRDCFAANIPMVGICFGHQIIAQAMGGVVEKFDGGWAVGRQEYEWAGTQVALNAWHQDQVTKRPEQAQVIATNSFCENAALLYQDRFFTIQPHPEFDADYAARLGEIRGAGVVPDPLMDEMRRNAGKPLHQSALARQIGTFFHTRRVE